MLPKTIHTIQNGIWNMCERELIAYLHTNRMDTNISSNGKYS